MLGSRMYWAVPRTLDTAGMLEKYYTDFSALKGWPRFFGLLPDSLRPPKVSRLLGRGTREVPAAKTTAFNLFGLEYARRLRRSRNATETTGTYLWAGREFCKRSVSQGFGEAGAVFTYNSAGLELLREAKARGLKTVMEQTIAPKRIETEILMEEFDRYPKWEASQGRDELAVEYGQREAAEWQAADLILCGSEFVVEGIARCGGPVGKCLVVPYGVDVQEWKSEVRSQKSEVRNRPLRVLTAGTVGLRKGAPYVLEAAKKLKKEAEFRMVGQIAVTDFAKTELSQHLQLTGPVARSQMASHFAWADVFLLPSLCEGSATVIYEALGHGLPVICTPNAGSVVRDGQEGFIVPNREVEQIIDRLRILYDQPEALRELTQKAKARGQNFTLNKYSHMLIKSFKIL